MFKCIGVCSRCGKCKNAALMNDANDRKTKNVSYPPDFMPEKGACGLGMAYDMGTTTVVGILWDLESGEQVDSCARSNPQNEFGMDVISRITFCGDDSARLKILQGKMTDCMNGIAEELCRKNGSGPEQIWKVTVCGNTTMSHLFAGYPPKSLALAPFTPAYEGTLVLRGAEAGLNIAEDAAVTVLPNIAGHVGGDITAGILASRFLEEKELTVFIDIGTNGEIALTDGVNRFACSTAAGPTFEGASIRCGMRAATGAVEKVYIEDGDVFVKTIGACDAQGICGSGIIDAVAQMLKHNLINKRGRLISAEDAEKLGLNEKFKERLITEGKERQFVLVPREEGGDIVITQGDIREIQLAKGAIAAGIQLMLNEAGKTVSDIEKVVVAGAFGNHIDKESAVAVGILPDIERSKIHFAGNSAGAGVSMVLVSEEEMENAKRIPELVKHVELADKENFQDVYVSAMSF